MSVRKIVFAVVLLLVTLSLRAEGGKPFLGLPSRLPVINYGIRDNGLSLIKQPTLPQESLPKYNFWALRSTQVGLGLVGSGLVLTAADIQTRSLIGDYLPTFRYKYDDYLQFAPLAAMAVMKSLGLESRSSWGRMIISTSISMGVLMLEVYGVKYGVGRLRPDGTTYNSFPSGHTAMAFTAASALHKEYGYLSPWVGIAGYTAATVTGISRALNNRHWLSDVVVGAGMGILATELGYLISDKLFGARGLVRPVDEFEPIHLGRNPSYVGVGIAHNLLLYDKERYRMVTRSGISYSVEGAWFINSKIGVGGVAKVGRYANIIERELLAEGAVVEPKGLNSHSLSVGLFLNQPLGNKERFHLGVKSLVGISRNQHLENAIANSQGEALYTIEYHTTEHLTAIAGVSLRRVVADNLGVRLYVDYNYICTDWSIKDSEGDSSRHSSYHSPLTFGIAVDALLW